MSRLLAPVRSSSASRASSSSTAKVAVKGQAGKAAGTTGMKAGVSTPSLVQVRGYKTEPSGAIMQRPERSRPFDVCMSSVTIFAGIATGAWIAKETAAKLEDLDVFVPDDDDDDD